MSNYQIRFQYKNQGIFIQCQKDELMNDIINRYGTKSGLSINKLYFLYDGKTINTDLTLGKLNDEDKEVLINVYPKEIEQNEIEKLTLEKSTQCSDAATKNYENEILLKIQIKESNINNTIFFLDNSDGLYDENGGIVRHNHDNLNELNENNTRLIIDGKTVSFKKSFIPTKSGIYSIKLSFKIKLSNCAYMFCSCKNIIDIDFSKFDTEKITDMKFMFYDCSGLKSLNLSSFNTQNVINMENMFSECSSLTTLNLSSFDTQNVISMKGMLCGCFSLVIVNLSSFYTQNVENMECMYFGCSSLTSINLSSFNTQNVINMKYMFSRCSSLKKVNLSSFSAEKASTFCMFYGCLNLWSCGSSDKNIVREFKHRN